MYGKKMVIILNIICPILSLYNISITTKGMKAGKYHQIYYTRYMGRPIEVLMNGYSLTENNDYKYENNYLSIRSKFSNNNITLIWDDSIGQEDIMTDLSNMDLIDDNINVQSNNINTNILNDESNSINVNTNNIFSDIIFNEKSLNTQNINKDEISEEIFTDLSLSDLNNKQKSYKENQIDSSQENIIEFRKNRYLTEESNENIQTTSQIKETLKEINSDNSDLFISGTTNKINKKDILSDKTTEVDSDKLFIDEPKESTIIQIPKKETSNEIIKDDDDDDSFISHLTYKKHNGDIMSDSTLNTENIFETNPPSTIFEEHIEIKKINLNAEDMFKDCEVIETIDF